MTLRDLPALEAIFNAVSTGCILLGLICIKCRRPKAHIVFMIAALVASAAFLACYLTYHGSQPEPLRFDVQRYPSWCNLTYKFVLWTHIPLAPVAAVLVILTVLKAARRQFAEHRRLAQWTVPVWLYVSITGVLVYLMLYRWWPPAALIHS